MTNTLSIKIFTGLKCNSCCIYCDEPLDDGASFNKFNEVEQIISSLKLPISEIELDGKESFEFPEILSWVRKFDIPIYIFTNGTMITEDFVKTMPDNFRIRISLDGPQDIHDKQRKLRNGKSSFEATMKGIRLLQKYNKSFVVAVTLTEYSVDYLNEIREFLSHIPATRFILTTEVRENDLDHTKRIFEKAAPIVKKWRDIRFELHSFHDGPEETLSKKELMFKNNKIQLNEIGFKTPIVREWSWEEIDSCIKELNNLD